MNGNLYEFAHFVYASLMVHKSKLIKYDRQNAYVTKDGSEIVELVHPNLGFPADVSVAQARLLPGGETINHSHKTSREIYYVAQGYGIIHLDGRQNAIGPGDAVDMLPGTVHKLENNGQVDLIILCVCLPPYSHEDTELGEPETDDETDPELESGSE